MASPGLGGSGPAGLKVGVDVRKKPVRRAEQLESWRSR